MTATDSLVRTVNEKLVHDANNTAQSQSDPWLLGPLDSTVAPIIPTAIVFLYDRASSSENFISVDRLQKATEILLDYYPHLTGRLTIRDEDKAPQLERLGSGALFTTAECTAELSSFKRSNDAPLLISDLPDQGMPFIPPLSFSPDEAYKGIPFAVKHTTFKCGSVAVAVSVLHVVVDAAGFFHISRDLADLYRQLTEIAKGLRSDPPALANPPVIKSYLSDVQSKASEKERTKALSYQPLHSDLAPKQEPEAAGEAQKSIPTKPAHVTGRIYRFSRSVLDELKTSTSEALKASGNTTWISTFDALSALIYQRMYQSRVDLLKSQHSTDSIPPVSTSFLTSVDIRSRLGLDQKYIPNAVAIPLFTWPEEKELYTAPLHEVAATVHALSRNYTTSDIEATSHWVAHQPDKSAVRPVFGPRGPGCLLSAWNKFESYDAMVLDGVRPCRVAAPFTPINRVDGLVYYLQTEELPAGSSLDVYVALDDGLWEFFEEGEWMQRAQCLTAQDEPHSDA